ncbi:phosphopantetheine-binding protein [Streptomyces sp. NPDC052095]|uniref:acyl carrier protein n=1 Tax=unclassified Streptomyces TaxID=2593676 RepID=UPI00344C423A
MQELNDIETRVMNVLAKALSRRTEPVEISPDVDMVAGLGLDSLEAIEFLLQIEDEFDIELDFENLSLQQLNSVRTFSAEVVARREASR